MSLTRVEVENNLAFLERCQLTGKEAETMVRLRYKLIAIREELLKKETEAGKTSKPPAKPRLGNRGKRGK